MFRVIPCYFDQAFAVIIGLRYPDMVIIPDRGYQPALLYLPAGIVHTSPLRPVLSHEKSAQSCDLLFYTTLAT